MDTNELKAAIERVRERIHSRGLSCDDQMNDVLALAEIGRLAVEDRRVEMEPTWDTDSTWVDRAVKSENARNAAADAFLAGRGK